MKEAISITTAIAEAPAHFGGLTLRPQTLRAITKMGWTQPTPIQARVIPLMVDDRDLVGQAQTGSGKTGAYGIPMVERLDPALRTLQALVLVPTRELAIQVTEELRALGRERGFKVVTLYGGQSIERQFADLRRHPHIAVATPGRLLDHTQRGTVTLDKVGVVVLDEADRMLDMGFIVDVETILARCPRQRQTALFSATMPYAILRICDRFMRRNPEHLAVRPELKLVETVRQLVYFVAEQDKVAALVELSDRFGFDRLLVFRHTQIGVDRLTASLKRRGRNVAALHGGLSQREREKTLAAFKSGQIQFLVATNVASRGLDITDLPYVLSYDIPEDADTYIHRVGRTARMGRSGTAITFVAEWDLDAWQAIRSEVGMEVEEGELSLYR